MNPQIPTSVKTSKLLLIDDLDLAACCLADDCVPRLPPSQVSIFIGENSDEKMIDYLIVEREKNRAIGEIYLKLPDGTENHNYVRMSDGIIIMVRPEFGILLGEKKYSSKNYGAESIKLLFDYAKDAYTLDHIYGRVYTFNIGAQRFFKRLKFENQGLIKDSSNEVCYLFHKMI